MKKLFCFCLIFISTLLSPFSWAYDEAFEKEVINKLQTNLNSDYLSFLETYLGQCDDNFSNCIKNKSDYKTVIFSSNNEICFPNTLCGYYHCMENRYHCSSYGSNYFTDLAYPTCSKYVENIRKGKFTNAGIEWIYNVMVCLQKGLTNECDLYGNCQKEDLNKICQHIVDFTLSYHPGCYINSGVGVCHLPLNDKISIWRTVSPFMTQKERIEAYKVIFHCALN